MATAAALSLHAAEIAAAKVEDRIVAIVKSDLILSSDMAREWARERERIQKQYRGEEQLRRLSMRNRWP